MSRQWTRIKAKATKGPGGLHSHTAIAALDSMFVFGGEREGQLLHELWRFDFGKQQLVNLVRMH